LIYNFVVESISISPIFIKLEPQRRVHELILALQNYLGALYYVYFVFRAFKYAPFPSRPTLHFQTCTFCIALTTSKYGLYGGGEHEKHVMNPIVLPRKVGLKATATREETNVGKIAVAVVGFD